MVNELQICEWTASHPRWPEVVQFFDDHEDGLPDVIQGYDQRDSRILVATVNTQIAGILRLIVIPIGPEENLPAVSFNDRELLQAKVMRFHVLREFRRNGIGTRLQQAAISLARSLSCYQLASFSDDGLTANHILKLRMGFSVRPVSLTEERHGLYFIMPLCQVEPHDEEC